MEPNPKRNSFDWTKSSEPHVDRRKLILEKYPEIKKLYGHDKNMKWAIMLLGIIQLSSLHLLKDVSWPILILSSYFFGAVINSSLSVTIHDLSHNFAFGHKYPLPNKLLGVFSSLFTGISTSLSYRKYHWEHHLFLGDETKDIDVATELEGKIFNTPFRKFLWILMQPFINILRTNINPKPITNWEILNGVIQIMFNISIWHIFGARMLFYLFLSTYFALSFHPIAGHLISSHCIINDGYETFSYYGCLNWFTFNIGYHNEHHDFPNIAPSNLPKVREIAKEFYEDLPYHTSWTKLLWDFVMKPEYGPYARVKRKNLK